MTWWRDWKHSGEMRFGMSKMLDVLYVYFNGWNAIVDEFSFDSEQIDCVLEQLWAIREGLSN